MRPFPHPSCPSLQQYNNPSNPLNQSWSNFWTDTETSSYATIDINLCALMRGTRLAIRDQVTRSPNTNATDPTFTTAAAAAPTSTPSTTTVTTTGIILNISSLAAQFALLNQPLYGASKAAVSSFTRSLAPLHALFGIKVVAVAPGMVNTPLWTQHPDKLKAVSWNEADVVLEPEEVADAMLRLVQGAEYAGGTVLEVLAEGRTRSVEVDSPVAEGRGATMSNMHLVTRDTVEILRREQAAGRGRGRGAGMVV
jgi:NAD(P)-dependent dehydrogenase (short-subunit alcohol dehydrogenase family)